MVNFGQPYSVVPAMPLSTAASPMPYAPMGAAASQQAAPAFDQYVTSAPQQQYAPAMDHHAVEAAGASQSHAHGPQVPPDTATIRSLLVDGSYGPTVEKGKAKTIDVPDGEGFGGIKGRQQNGGDKAQNNYSVTDANFYPALGLLQNTDTGKPFNYVQQTQAYSAAGYISTFHPDIYERMVAVQDAGEGSILGMALELMGVDGAPSDPGTQRAGLTAGLLANEQMPGSPISAKTAVMSGTDLAGEEWARPHHAESSWATYKALTDAGLDYQTAGVLSGDDAMSGAGRMNGFNNQDGTTGFNADEKAIYQIAAKVTQQTGIPVVQIMAGGHSHTGIHESAKTGPRIDKLTGMSIDSSDPTARANAIYEVLNSGKIRGGEIGKFDLDEQHRGMGFSGTVSSTLSDAVRATEAVQPKGVDGFVGNISDGLGDLTTNITSGLNNLFSGLFGGLFGGLLGAGHHKK